MLFRSGDNLEEGALSFINKHDAVTLYSAYLKLEELERININNRVKQIIVRWEIKDLCLGVSDLKLFQYCLDNKIALYRNTRIHLKALWNNQRSVFFGSANVTNKGLGSLGEFNYELNGLQENISFDDILYLSNIINTSEYVSEALYLKIKKLVDETILPVVEYPKLDTVKENEIDFFLLSQLPMVKHPEDLFQISSSNDYSSIEIACAAHDLALYNVSFKLTETVFFEKLKNAFNSHPFINKFKEAIRNSKNRNPDRDGSLQFGVVRQWFAENTTTVPTPRTFELTENVQILYDWICYFDNEYTQGVPGAHSQVIRYVG
jgi:hypothetical protein